MRARRVYLPDTNLTDGGRRLFPPFFGDLDAVGADWPLFRRLVISIIRVWLGIVVGILKTVCSCACLLSCIVVVVPFAAPLLVALRENACAHVLA